MLTHQTSSISSNSRRRRQCGNYSVLVRAKGPGMAAAATIQQEQLRTPQHRFHLLLHSAGKKHGGQQCPDTVKVARMLRARLVFRLAARQFELRSIQSPSMKSNVSTRLYLHLPKLKSKEA